MGLTEINYGSLASSSIMNNNFQHLDNRISDLSNTIASNQAEISSNIANINSSINTMQENTNKKVEELKARNYIKKSYVNGTSGYRIWNDNFCEQWGYSTFNGNAIALLQKYKDTNYNITFSIDAVSFAGQVAHPELLTKKDNSFIATYVAPKGNTSTGRAHWHTIGFIEEGNTDGI